MSRMTSYMAPCPVEIGGFWDLTQYPVEIGGFWDLMQLSEFYCCLAYVAALHARYLVFIDIQKPNKVA